MKKLFFLAMVSLLVVAANAQQEELSPLQYNPALYHATKAQQPGKQHRYLIDKGYYVVSTDTLQLPFVDDFSSNNTATLNWNQTHITDTFRNVFGTCLATEGVPLTEGRFRNTASWSYTFDTLAQQFDSTANAPMAFTFFGPSTSNCFLEPPSAFNFWNTYYRYFVDTAGRIDSAFVDATDVIYYAPLIYFVQGEPDKLWADNYAYINSTYPVNPPTIGVATFDGLNEYGLPYNNSSSSTYGRADYLTSKPINLSAFNQNDNIYLSFFVEPKGLGDYPDLEDSLVLEFKDRDNQWRMVWFQAGYLGLAAVADTFKQVLVKVDSLAFPYSYYFPTFQFRFRNNASLYGNNDHWHIDYVKLDKNRSANDTIIMDIAYQYPFPTILKNFTLMPADQFNFPNDLSESIVLPVRNLDPNANNNPPATNFVKGANEIYPSPVVIAPDLLVTFNAAEYSTTELNPFTEYAIPTTPNWPVDSLITTSRVFIQPNDSRPGNDTLNHTQVFDNVMAYDDGSAEQSYGITGVGLKMFAYEFNLNQPDTLSAFQVQYSQVEEDVSNLVFNFYVWDSLEMNNYLFNAANFQRYSMDNKKPYYIDSLNGFTTYKMDTTLILSGKFYFGWAQTDTRRLQVGYDLNSKLGRSHMYIFTQTSNVWKPSSIATDGSPMIRMIFDGNYKGGTSAVNDLEEDRNIITVYPNPTNGFLNIRSEKINAQFDADVVNMLGETVMREQNIGNQLNISQLPTGIYLLTLRDAQSGKMFHSKVIKTAF
jgi:hypothetical protein